jgi:Tol biopolymer transport system component/tRNA A-37 threonylcarbamoyl transferase component Bud32
MPLSAGDKLGPYEILSAIGAGGMGEVWKARDTRLNRTVAIKTSKLEFNERFEREARAVAALNHPHICQLYDVGPNYLVMEYIDGKALKGPLPLEQALGIGIQLADALDAAHKRGITHRDLKPANALLTKSGVKVLDFGLARIEQRKTIGVDDATLTHSITEQGAILGTLQYMAPEQLQAKEDVDSRADIFSFGCVMYEMLTGKRAFEGANAASVIAAILERPAPSVGEAAPAALDRVLKKCLAKDPEQRWQSARDVKHALECFQEPAVVALRSRNRRELAGYGLALCLAAGLAALYLRQQAPPPSSGRISFTLAPPEKAAFRGGSAAAISPDGSRLAADITSSGGPSGIWIRPLDSLLWHPVRGTTQASGRPAWSPDGQSLVINNLQSLERLDLSAGSRQTLCSGYSVYSAAWGSANVILFSRNNGPIYRVDASGGSCAPATTLDVAHGEAHHYSPKFLPDGRHFLFLSGGQRGNEVIWAASLDSSERVRLVTGTGGAAYTGPARGPGYLLYEKEGIPMAQSFDPVRLRLSGEPMSIPGLQKVSAYPAFGVPSISASQNGTLIQRDPNVVTEFVWFDRSGTRLESVGRGDAYSHLSLSHDDQRLVYTGSAEVGSGTDIWMSDLSRDNAKTRVNKGESFSSIPVWSADGSQVAYGSAREAFKLFSKAADGTGQEQLLAQSGTWIIPSCWSADGQYLVYHQSDPKTGFDIWVLPLSGDRKPRPYLRTDFDERNGRVSPDGRWMAYTSNESGELEIYVRTFPDANGGKWHVSVGGGAQPEWRRDGKELFYLSPELKVVSVEVKPGPGGFQAGRPRVLFTRPRAGLGYTNLGMDYAVSADGKRFLANTAVDDGVSSNITVLTNWSFGLRK